MPFALLKMKPHFAQAMIMGKSGLTIYGGLLGWVMAVKWLSIHSQPVTSIYSLEGGNVMLTSGRDSLHNLIDVRTMQVCGKFNYIGQGGQNILATKYVSPWWRFCCGGFCWADGTIYVWSMRYSAPVLCSSWSGMGNPMASAHDDGTICIWLQNYF